MTSEPARPEEAASERKSPVRFLLVLLVVMIVIDAIAFVVFPPFDPHPAEGQDPSVCSFPVCFINGTLELPAPHVVFPIGHHLDPEQLVVWDVSISSSILTMWIVAVLILVTFYILTRGRQLVPRGRQNFAEWVYETAGNFGESLGGTLLGYWIDGQLHSLPIFALAGFLGGAGIGAFGIYRLVTRFLARFE